MDISRQFIGKTSWIALCAITALHILAFFMRDTWLEVLLMIFIGLAVLVISWKSQLNGMLVAFAEIFVGGHGHLLDFDIYGFSFSLRILIFLIVMGVWLIKNRNIKLSFNTYRDLPWTLITLAVLIGTINGIVNNNPSAVFDDMNGYIVIGYLLPILSIEWTQNKRLELLHVFFACLIWIIAFSAILGFTFTHFDGKFLDGIYSFVRDSRLAEVTLQVIDNKGSLLEVYTTEIAPSLTGDYWFRIFMPSQLTTVFGVLLFFSAMIYLWRKERLPIFVSIIFIASTLALFLSLSRSFLLGCALAGVILFVSAWFFGNYKQWIVYRTFFAILFSFVSIITIYALVDIPVPQRPDLTDAAFYETSAQTGRTEAVVSRWNLLDAIMVPIMDHPIIGSGFGALVSYDSEDPRIISELGGQEYETYRFEWGWHDIWLKMGALGLIAFCSYIIFLIRASLHTMSTRGHKWIIAGLLAGIIAVFITHIFSPYLNHPLGIGFMLFIIPFIDWDRLRNGRKRSIKVSLESVKQMPQTASVSLSLEDK